MIEQVPPFFQRFLNQSESEGSCIIKHIFIGEVKKFMESLPTCILTVLFLGLFWYACIIIERSSAFHLPACTK